MLRNPEEESEFQTRAQGSWRPSGILKNGYILKRKEGQLSHRYTSFYTVAHFQE